MKVSKLLSSFLLTKTKRVVYSIYCFQNNQFSDLNMQFIAPSPEGEVEPAKVSYRLQSQKEWAADS